jgi:flagellar biosynthesis protein FlhB
MKGISTITNILKVIVKYGAFVAVAIKVIQFAHDEFSKLNNDEPVKAVKDVEVISEQV